MADIRIDITDELHEAAKEHVAAASFADVSALVSEALRYYLERHRDEDWREYVSEEIAWSQRQPGG